MRVDNIDLRGTTAADGTLTKTSTKAVFGRLYGVEWIDGDLVDGVDATLKVVDRQSGVDRTLFTLTNANDDKMYYPREQVHDNVGDGLYYDAADSEPVDEEPLIDGKLQMVVTSGGNAKTGGMIVFVDLFE